MIKSIKKNLINSVIVGMSTSIPGLIFYLKLINEVVVLSNKHYNLNINYENYKTIMMKNSWDVIKYYIPIIIINIVIVLTIQIITEKIRLRNNKKNN